MPDRVFVVWVHAQGQAASGLYAFAVGSAFGREPGGQSDVLWWEFGQATGVCAIEAIAS